jgi:hypothetical protein
MQTSLSRPCGPVRFLGTVLRGDTIAFDLKSVLGLIERLGSSLMDCVARLLFEPEATYHPVLGEDLIVPCSASGSPKVSTNRVVTSVGADPDPGFFHQTNGSGSNSGSDSFFH